MVRVYNNSAGLLDSGYPTATGYGGAPVQNITTFSASQGTLVNQVALAWTIPTGQPTGITYYGEPCTATSGGYCTNWSGSICSTTDSGSCSGTWSQTTPSNFSVYFYATRTIEGNAWTFAPTPSNWPVASGYAMALNAPTGLERDPGHGLQRGHSDLERGRNATSYSVQYSTNGTTFASAATGLTSTTATIASSATGTLYWQVQAVGAGGAGPWSSSVTGYPLLLGATFGSQSAVPTTLVAGASFTPSISFTNTGNQNWTAGSNYKLGSQTPPAIPPGERAACLCRRAPTSRRIKASP